MPAFRERSTAVFPIATLVILVAANLATAQPKRALDHDAYEVWNSIKSPILSDDGEWMAYSEGPEDGDRTLRMRHVESGSAHEVARGSSAQFASASDYLVFLISPPRDSVRQAKIDGVEDEQMPTDSLGILRLADGLLDKTARVQSFRMPEKDGEHVAFLYESDAVVKDSLTAKPDSSRADSCKGEDPEKPSGSKLSVRRLVDGASRQFEHVTEYVFSKHGKWLVFATSSKDGVSDGMYALETASDSLFVLSKGPGLYEQFVVDDQEEQVAFLSNRLGFLTRSSSYDLYYWRTGSDSARVAVTDSTEGIPPGWEVGSDGSLTFSKDGSRVLFGTRPARKPDCQSHDVPEDERVVVDVWSWTDPVFYLEQVEQLEDEKKRTYRAVYHVNDDLVVQLADEAVPEITIGSRGNADVAVGNSPVRYRKESSWDYPAYYDAYVIDIQTGERRRVVEKVQSRASLSPENGYLSWWDRDSLAWFAQPAQGGIPVNLTSRLPYPVHNEDHDLPHRPGAYGSGGWTKADERFIVYDRFDVWAVDPSGIAPAHCLTEERGRTENIRYRYLKLDPEEQSIDPAEPILLSTFNRLTKAGGFATDRVEGSRPPQALLAEDRLFSRPTKAKGADVVFFTKENFVDFPDIWVSDLSFQNPERVTRANPQQEDYRWGSVELVHWVSADGAPLDGLLFKPDGFDLKGSYPLLVYFYERNSDNLHRHIMPAPHRSIINITFYVSRGYVVFVPDIRYRIGYPGESAENAVLPGVTHVIRDGYIDTDRIGVQGHSWGGYQIAHLVTKTNMFRAAEAGAPVSNMVSAYGGIRWKSGKSRMFQYERTQSRIGGSLWEYPLRYLDNSPIFRADMIETPLLIMHNDHDGAVPWTQGIELFNALRRLGKPAWLINYNNEPHWPVKYLNKRDWTIRLQQYFDHYLMDAPAPRWMTGGIPAIEKGKTLGLETMSDG